MNTFRASLLAFCVIAYLASCSENTKGISNCEIGAAEPRDILASTLPISKMWAVHGFGIQNYRSKALMVSTPELIIGANTDCDKVLALDWTTGKKVWEFPPSNVGEPVVYDRTILQPRNLALDYARERVYVSATREIRALSIEDGSTLWSTGGINFDRNAHSVFVLEDGQVTVDARGFWYVDPYTGDLSKSPIELHETNLEYQPTVDESVEDLVRDISEYSVISNAVKANNTIYVLDELARLHLLSPDDGSEIGYVQFELPEKLEILYTTGAIGGSHLAVQDNLIAIFFQDTDLLSVYMIDM